MKSKGQSSAIIVVIILVVIAGAFFLYHEGYFNAKPSTTAVVTTNPYVPISLNISSTNNLAQLYTNQNINVISNVKNSRGYPINVTLSPYGCSFLINVPSKAIAIPADSPSAISWTFSGASPTTCTITFNACFNAVSYTEYPLTIKSYQFTGAVPTSSVTDSSGLPISVNLESFNTSIFAAPSPENLTEYANGVALTSDGSTSKLNWLSISISNAKGYFTTNTGAILTINPDINITNSEYPLTFQNNRLLAPAAFSLLINPVSNSVGYTNNVSINVSAGYTYCITSNSIPITLKQS